VFKTNNVSEQQHGHTGTYHVRAQLLEARRCGVRATPASPSAQRYSRLSSARRVAATSLSPLRCVPAGTCDCGCGPRRIPLTPRLATAVTLRSQL
jgi:hypothetical protein